MTQVRSNGRQLSEFGRLLDAGTVRVGIDSTFPLADAQKRTNEPRAGTSTARSSSRSPEDQSSNDHRDLAAQRERVNF